MLFRFINQTIANPFFDFLLPVLRNAYTWIPLYIFVGFFFLYKYKQKAWIYASYFFLAFALSDFTTHEFLKPWIARLRPCHSPTLNARLVLGHCGGLWSFPSTHASNHMAMAVSIILAQFFKSKKINFVWICWALAIGFAQIYVGVHYPSDILGGFIWGIGIGFLNYYALLPLLEAVHQKIIKK